MDLLKENLCISRNTFMKDNVGNINSTRNSSVKKKKALADVGNTLHLKTNGNQHNYNYEKPLKVDETPKTLKVNETPRSLKINESNKFKVEQSTSEFTEWLNVKDKFFSGCRCHIQHLCKEEDILPEYLQLTDHDMNVFCRQWDKYEKCPDLTMSPVNIEKNFDYGTSYSDYDTVSDESIFDEWISEADRVFCDEDLLEKYTEGSKLLTKTSELSISSEV